MKNLIYRYIFLFTLIFFLLPIKLVAQKNPNLDTTIIFTPADPDLILPHDYKETINAWGINLMMSNNGFGLGFFYRHEMTEDLSLMVDLAISDVKDEAEFERYDYYTGENFIPWKKNRLLLIPLMASVQYRLFRQDIMDNFRPYISAGLGPTGVFVAPYSRLYIYQTPIGNFYDQEKIEFFSSLKYGRMRYTIGGFIGAGAFFGTGKGNITGLSVKYLIAPFPDGIEVMYGSYMKNFGGLFIELTIGSLF